MVRRKRAAKRAVRLDAVVLEGHKGLAFELPFHPAERWGIPEVSLWPGRRGYRVRCFLGGVRFESAAVPRSKKFFVLVNEAMRKAGRLRAGSAVIATVEPAG